MMSKKNCLKRNRTKHTANNFSAVNMGVDKNLGNTPNKYKTICEFFRML